MLGTRWSPQSYELREFLARNHVPYQWLDVEAAERDPEVRRVMQSLEARRYCSSPSCCFPDGARLSQPDSAQLADRIGLRTHSDQEFYDLVIVGGGPAGLAAAVYGASEGLRTVIVERDAPGGQAGLSSRDRKLSRLSLRPERLRSHPPRRDAGQTLRRGDPGPQEAVGLQVEGPYRITTLADGSRAFLPRPADRHRRAVAQAERAGHGAADRRRRLLRRGLDGGGILPDEDVYIVGGANSAGQAAMNFAATRAAW